MEFQNFSIIFTSLGFEIGLFLITLFRERKSSIPIPFDTMANLRNLNLFANMIDVDGARALATNLKTNKTLEVLDLGYNRIKDEGIKQLGLALKENSQSSLRYLNVRYNLFTATHFENFLGNVTQNQLRVVMAKRNDIEDFFLKAIKARKEQVASLQYIDVLDKLAYFDEEVTARTLWIPSQVSFKNAIETLKKIDPNICVLSVSERKGRDYPNKTVKEHKITFIELGSQKAAQRVMRYKLKSAKKRTARKAVIMGARLAGTGRYYYDKKRKAAINMSVKVRNVAPITSRLRRRRSRSARSSSSDSKDSDEVLNRPKRSTPTVPMAIPTLAPTTIEAMRGFMGRGGRGGFGLMRGGIRARGRGFRGGTDNY